MSTSNREKPVISFGMNTVHITHSTLQTLIDTYKPKEAKQEDDPRTYYRDLANLGMRLHDRLKRDNLCSCSFSSGNTLPPVCCVLAPCLGQVFRRSFLVLPEEALFLEVDDDREKKKKRRRVKPPSVDLGERTLCITMLWRNDAYDRVEFLHCRNPMSIKALQSSNAFILNYEQAVAQEVWGALENRKNVSTQLRWKRNDPFGKELEASASRAARRKALPRWIAINPMALWPETTTFLGYQGETRAPSFLDGLSLSSNSILPCDTSHPSGRQEEEAYEPEKINYGVLRDFVVQNALGMHNLMEHIARSSIGEEEEMPVLPADASRISRESFSARRTCHTDEKHEEEDLVYSIKFFYTAAPAKKYARKHRLPMFAQDKAADSGAKHYFVPGSWFEAYRAIRLGEYEYPPPNAYLERVYNGRREPSFHSLMPYCHEYILAERRVKLFLDLDCDPKGNPQFCSPSTGLVDLNKVNRMTRDVIRWFTWFINRLFGEETCAFTDWIVLCATRPDRKISRHLRLAKPGCYFHTNLDLLAFIDLAKQQMTKDVAMRVPTQDHKEDALNPISWMIIHKKTIESVTKREHTYQTPIIDFSVYGEYGCIRSVFCAKMRDASRILSPVRDLFPGQDCTIVNTDVTSPLVSKETFGKQNRVNEEFPYYFQTLVTYVESGDGDGQDGWKMPIGAMSFMPAAKVPPSLVQRNYERVNENEKETGDDASNSAVDRVFSKAVYALMALPAKAWYSTSSLPEGAARRDVQEMIQNFMRSQGTLADEKARGGGAHKRKTCLGSWAYSREIVLETEDRDGIVKTIRSYFASQTVIKSGHCLEPWSRECGRICPERRCSRIQELLNTAGTEETDQEKADKFFQKGKVGTTKTTKENGNDHYLVKIRGTKWCPIAQREHSNKDKCYVRFYRDGRVVCGCFSDGCKERIHSVYGERAYYWQLPYLSPKHISILWN